jgi:hypothetical protein
MDDAHQLEQWLSRAHPPLKPRVKAAYRADAARFLAFVQKPLREATFVDLRAFLDNLASTGVKSGAREATSRRLEGLLWSLRWQRTEHLCAFNDGHLWRASLPARGLQIYSCDECDATWIDAAAISPAAWRSLSAIKDEYGLDDDDFAVL